MKLAFRQLPGQLKRTLAPIYLISSDEPLLTQQAKRMIYHASKQQGFSAREIMEVGTTFNVGQFNQLTQSNHLFAEKTILEIRNPSAKSDQKATKALVYYLEHYDPNKLIIITTRKLTSAQQKTKWVQAVTKAGVFLPIYALSATELPQWLRSNFTAAQLNADPEAIQALAELTEGNLLAAKQAIEKLRLLYPQQTIGAKEVADAISDNARFNIFDLVNYALLGNTKRVLRIVAGLKFEGTEAVLILWALTRELRELIALQYQHDHGASLSQLLNQQWASKRTTLQAALTRFNSQQLQQLLQWAADIDLMIKGIHPGDHWQALNNLALALAGAPTQALRNTYDPQ